MCLIPIISLTLIGGLIYLWLNSYELTITDKRVYGKVAFGKRVDLPVDSVSATSTISLFKGVSVSTSSGKISFLAIKNANEIYGVINNLLVDRQKEKAQSAGTTIVQNSDEADKLKKYKELLDTGVITQEEFDAKKKQLLGL
ncbi:MAG: SHOCT domain-containing protein [Ruminococcus sp.]|nr:SHOCT domain-containing protein [Ruminococcus sp.]